MRSVDMSLVQGRSVTGDHLREASGDLGVSVGGGVLVAHRGAGRRVAEATHQLGEDGAGVAGVVPAEVLAAGGLAGLVSIPVSPTTSSSV